MAEMSSSVTAKTTNTNSAKEGKRSTKMIETKERWNVKGITDVSSTMVSHLDTSKKACFHEDQSTARKLVISSSHHITSPLFNLGFTVLVLNLMMISEIEENK